MDKLFITDAFGNAVTTVEASSQASYGAKQVHKDTRGAVLESFSLDMEEGSMMFTFDEPVKLPLLAGAVTLHDAADSSSYFTLHPATSNTLFATKNLVSKIMLSSSDVLAIKAKTSLATSADSTFVAITNGTIFDLRDNKNIPLPDAASKLSTLKAANYTSDSTDPKLKAFHAYDGTLGQVQLSFDEPVDLITINESGIVIHSTSSPVNGRLSYRLTGSESVNYTDASKMSILLTMSEKDLENVLKLENLAILKGSTFISVDARAVKDMSKNGNAETPFNAALNVRTFGAIQEASLVNFDVNLNLAELSLTFSGVVTADSLQAQYITLQSSSTSNKISHTLSSTTKTTSSNGFVISMTLTDGDMNQIKKLRKLAADKTSTFISIESEAFDDIADRPILPIGPTKGKNVNKYTFDTTSPKLSSFSLDLDPPAVLAMQFSEMIDLDTFNASEVVIQGGTNSSIFVRLTAGKVAPTDAATGLNITLDVSDVNAIKHLAQLATGKTSTFVSFSDQLVADMNGQQIAAHSNVAAFGCDSYGVDKSPPSLIAFKLDMTLEVLTMTFSETVEVASLKPARITLQDDKTSRTAQHQLTGGDRVEVSATVLQLNLTQTDLNAIKATAGLTPATTIYMSLVQGVATDPTPNAARSISATDALQGAYVADTKPPSLKQFDLDMDNSLLTMHFSETIDAMSLKPDKLVIQSSKNSKDVSHPISRKAVVDTKASVSTTSDFTTIVVILAKIDMDLIKNLPALASGKADTYLSFAQGACTDVDGNPVDAVDSADAAQVQKYAADGSPPTMLSFAADFNLNILTLNFDEPVALSSVNPKGIRLQSAKTSAGAGFGLTGGNTTRGPDGKVIVLSMLADDVNTMAKNETLCVDENSTFMSITSDLVRDMATVKVATISANAARKTSLFIEDKTRPRVTSFDLNMNNGTIVFHFNETMDISSFNVTQVALQSSSNTGGDASLRLALTGGKIVSLADGLKLEVTLLLDDLNALKIQGIGATSKASFLTVAKNAITDMADQAVLPHIDGANALPVRVHVADTTHPDLLSAHLSMDSGNLTLSFSETVRANSFQSTYLTIHTRTPRNDSNSFALTIKSQPDFAVNSPQIIIVLSTADLNQIKLRETVAVSKATSIISLNVSCIADMQGLGNTGSSKNVAVTSFEEDKTPPVLVSYDLNLDGDGSLALHFSETMKATQMDATLITLQLIASSNSVSYALKSASVDPQDGTTIKIKFLAKDLNHLKYMRTLAVSGNTTYLTLDTGGAKDMNMLPNVPVRSSSAMKVTKYTKDATPPELVAFSFNSTSSFVSLTFSETVDAASVKPKEITLFSTDGANASKLILTGGAVSKVDSTVIRIGIKPKDLNTIKADPALAVSKDSTFLSFTPAMVKDTAANQVTGSVQKAAAFAGDSVAPELQSFDLNLTSGIAIFYFSETVNASSLSVPKFTLTGKSTHHTFTACDVATLGAPTTFPHSETLELTISRADLDEIKRSPGLCTSTSDCVLSVQSSAVVDMNRNGVKATQVPVGVFSGDDKSPSILSFGLDMNTGVLSLSFDETVNADTLNVSRISLFAAANQTLRLRLTESSAGAKKNNATLHITLSGTDLDKLKALQIVSANSADVQILVDAAAALDMSNNPVAATNKVVASTILEDKTAPTLESWTIDVDTGLLKAKFSEIMNITSLKRELFRLLGKKNSSEALQLLGDN